jgi:hypothetical protein
MRILLYKDFLNESKEDLYVWKKSGKKYDPLGEIVEILPNDKHPEKAISARIKERGGSLFSLSSLIKSDPPVYNI